MMTFYEIVKISTLLSPSILLLGVVIGAYFYKSLDVVHKNITLFLFIMLCIDFTGRIIEGYGNNLIVLLIYSLIEMSLFIYFYYKYLFKAKHRLIMGLCLVSFFYIIWEITVLNKIEAKQFQSYAKVADNFVIITLALTYFHEKINIFKESKWDNFQLNAVVLIFFFINMIFFLPINFLINESSGLKFYFWLGNLIITVLFYSYLTHSIWKNGRTRKLLPSGSR